MRSTPRKIRALWAVGVLAGLSIVSVAEPVTIQLDTPTLPPRWALMERHLFDLMREAAVTPKLACVSRRPAGERVRSVR